MNTWGSYATDQEPLQQRAMQLISCLVIFHSPAPGMSQAPHFFTVRTTRVPSVRTEPPATTMKAECSNHFTTHGGGSDQEHRHNKLNSKEKNVPIWCVRNFPMISKHLTNVVYWIGKPINEMCYTEYNVLQFKKKTTVKFGHKSKRNATMCIQM